MQTLQIVEKKRKRGIVCLKTRDCVFKDNLVIDAG